MSEFRRSFSGAPWESRVGYCRSLRAGNRVWIGGTAPVAEVRLRGPNGNPTAIGARLTLVEGPGAGRVFELRAGSSYLSQSSPAIHLARSGGEPLTVHVRWPDGAESTHRIESAAGEHVTLERP